MLYGVPTPVWSRWVYGKLDRDRVGLKSTILCVFINDTKLYSKITTGQTGRMIKKM